jgi:hypothetical protein
MTNIDGQFHFHSRYCTLSRISSRNSNIAWRPPSVQRLHPAIISEAAAFWTPSNLSSRRLSHTLDRQHCRRAAKVSSWLRLQRQRGNVTISLSSLRRQHYHLLHQTPPTPPSLSRQHTCLDSSGPIHTTTPYPHSSASLPVRCTSIPP